MEKIILASNNSNKVREVKEILRDMNVEITTLAAPHQQQTEADKLTDNGG